MDFIRRTRSFSLPKVHNVFARRDKASEMPPPPAPEPLNQAAWIDGAGERLEVRPADMPQPGPDEVVIRNRAVAINPIDWKMQDGFFLNQMSLPMIIGCDVAGEIHEVGSQVKGFRKGDRVMAHCINMADKKSQSGAFQLYSAANSVLVSRLPHEIKFRDAAVLPLAISTAVEGLYAKDKLALPLPTCLVPAPAPVAPRRAILVYGASSSVGSVTVQLARASGLVVIATASAHNLPAVMAQLGADLAFDHQSETLVEDVVAAVRRLRDEDGIEFAGIYDAISLPGTHKIAGLIFDRLGDEGVISCKKLATVLPYSDLPSDVEAKYVLAAWLVKGHRDIAEAVWGGFIPEALAKGVLKPLPAPLVVGRGLKSIQDGVDLNKKGVSFSKVVIEL